MRERRHGVVGARLVLDEGAPGLRRTCTLPSPSRGALARAPVVYASPSFGQARSVALASAWSGSVRSPSPTMARGRRYVVFSARASSRRSPRRAHAGERQRPPRSAQVANSLSVVASSGGACSELASTRHQGASAHLGARVLRRLHARGLCHVCLRLCEGIASAVFPRSGLGGLCFGSTGIGDGSGVGRMRAGARTGAGTAARARARARDGRRILRRRWFLARAGKREGRGCCAQREEGDACAARTAHRPWVPHRRA